MIKGFFAPRSRDRTLVAEQKPAVGAGGSQPARATPSSQVVPITADQRVFETIEIARSLDDLPAFVEVLTGEGGTLAVAEVDRRRVAMVLLDGDEAEQRGIIVWTNRADAQGALRILTDRARVAGVQVAGHFEARADLVDLLHDEASVGVRGKSVESLSGDAPGAAEATLDRLVGVAAKLDASDIHIQYNRGGATNIYMRVDGELTLEGQYKAELGEALSRVCYVQTDDHSKQGSMRTEYNPAVFQGGTLARHVDIGGRPHVVRLRLASLPVFGGAWNIVLRVQIEGQGGNYWPLERCGYDQNQIKAFRRMLAYPSGLILMVGTTGSGKSRTLQSLMGLLYEIYRGRKAQYSVEDPPEYIIPGTRQIPVPRGEGIVGGFGEAVRECLRADPDILMVGEIRDVETAQALQTGVQTGHKGLSTLHAANAHIGFQRLVDLGIERSVVATPGFVQGIIYQRLLPHVCEGCALTFEDARATLPDGLENRVRLASSGRLETLRFRGPGCDACGFRGIKGRSVAAEMLVPDMDYLSRFAVGDAVGAQMHWRSATVPVGGGVVGRTALDHGIEKMMRGIVSPQDVESELGPLDSGINRAEAATWVRRHASTPAPVVTAIKSAAQVAAGSGG